MMRKNITRKNFLNASLGLVGLGVLGGNLGCPAGDDGDTEGDPTTGPGTGSGSGGDDDGGPSSDSAPMTGPDESSSGSPADSSSSGTPADSSGGSSSGEDSGSSSSGEAGSSSSSGGEESSSSSDGGAVCKQVDFSMNLHTHPVDVPAEDVATGAQMMYLLELFNGHTHMMTVTAANFTTLADTGEVVVTSTMAAGHSHNVTLTCS